MPLHLGKIHKIGENKAIFGLGMPPVSGGKTSNLKIKSLIMYISVIYNLLL